MSARSADVRALPCVCCSIEGQDQPSRTEEHHLNSFGQHGKKRRGDAFSIPLCGWHHQGRRPIGMTVDESFKKFGPSWKLTPKKFRERYHGDDFLLNITNNCIESGRFEMSAELTG